MKNGKMGSYNNTDVLTAKKTKLVLMMYDGAIRFAEEGLRRIQIKDIEGRGIFIGKSQKVVLELMNVLDMDEGGEIAKSFSRLYAFINRNLTMANIRGEEKFVIDSLKVLNELRNGWTEMSSQTDSQPVTIKPQIISKKFTKNFVPRLAVQA